MKSTQVFLSILFIFISTILNAQIPEGIPYQAIARNGQGLPLANLPVKVRFSVLDSILTGPVVYSEIHATTTSTQGLFSVNVGMGNSTTGLFSSINWGVNAKFLKVELDTTASGSNYVDLGTQQMMSVPYALYAGKANTTFQNSGPFFISPLEVYNINNSGVTNLNINISIDFDTLIGQHVNAVILYYEHLGNIGMNENPVKCTVDALTNGISYEICDHYYQSYSSYQDYVYGGSSGQFVLPLSNDGIVIFFNSLIRTGLKVKLIGYYN